MAEAAAAIGLVSSIISLVEFSAKLVSRLNEFNSRTTEAPETFRTIAIQLPLLTATLQRVRHQASAGQVDNDIVKALQPVIAETANKVQYIDGEIAKITPPQTASSLEKGLKALKSISKERDISKALDKIHECINVLVLHQSTSGVDINVNVLDRLTELIDNTLPAAVRPPSNALVRQAIKQGELPSIRAVFRLGGDFNAQDESGRSALHIAAQCGQIKIVRFVHSKSKDPDLEDDNGQTPCHLAVIAGHIEVARFLLQNGARKDIKDDAGKTPVDYVQSDFESRWQLQHGSDLEGREPKTGNTALIQAAVEGKASDVKRLLDGGADIQATNNRLSTALAEACIHGQIFVISELVARGANPNAVDSMNWTPFTRCIWAYKYGSLIRMLNEAKVDVNTTKTNHGYSAIAEAMRRGQWSTVRVLLERGADPNAMGTYKSSSLLRGALISWREEDLILLILKCGANVNAVDGDGWSPMTQAIEHRDWHLMELLLKNGASANGMHGDYPYISRLAQWNTSSKYIRMLVEHGADVNSVNSHGYTVLHEAIDLGQADLVTTLLALKANPKIRYPQWHDRPNTPTLIAAVWYPNRSLSIVDILISWGAKLEDKDSFGWTALRAAVERGHDDTACALLLRGANANDKAEDGLTSAERGRGLGLQEFCALLDASEARISMLPTKGRSRGKIRAEEPKSALSS